MFLLAGNNKNMLYKQEKGVKMSLINLVIDK